MIEIKKLLKLNSNVIKEMSFEEVYKRYERYLHKECKTYSENIEYEDVFQIASIGLYKAYKTYNNIDVNLLTYASIVIKNEILMNIRNNKKKVKTVSINSIGYWDKEYDSPIEWNSPDISVDIEEEVGDKVFIKETISSLNDEEKELIREYFFRNKKQDDLARELNISQTYLSKKIRRVISKIRTSVNDVIQ